MRSVVGAVVGGVLLLGVAAVTLLVAAAGSSVGVDLVWQRVGLAVRPSALGLFLVGAVAVLLGEVAVRLLLAASTAARRRHRSGRARRAAP